MDGQMIQPIKWTDDVLLTIKCIWQLNVSWNVDIFVSYHLFFFYFKYEITEVILNVNFLSFKS